MKAKYIQTPERTITLCYTFISYLFKIISTVVWVASNFCFKSDEFWYGLRLGELQ
jgi:hypothetical protein